MVRLAGFASINDERREEQIAQQTIEAQEARVIDEYERGLREVAASNLDDAEAAFQGVLADQMVVDGATEQLQRLRFLALKNLAGVVAAAPGRTPEALTLFAAAAAEDASDVALWDRFGSLAASAGEWATARAAFAAALSRDPRHPTASAKLLQVLMHVGDVAGAQTFAQRCLDADPWHPLARRVAAGGDAAAAAGAALLTLPEVHDAGTPLAQAAPAQVALERGGGWAALLSRCAELLSSPATAAGTVVFMVPEEGQKQQADDVIDLTGSDPQSQSAAPAEVPAAQTAAQTPASVAPEAAQQPPQQQQPEQQQQDTEMTDAAAATAATEAEKEKKDAAAKPAKPAPQRRSARATRGHHSLHSPVKPGAGAIDGGDPYELLKALAPTLHRDRPDSRQLAAPRGARDAAEGPLPPPPVDAAVQAQEVAACALITRSDAPVPVATAAASLVAHWTAPEAAKRLPALPGAAPALLRIAGVLEAQQMWRGDGLTSLQCLVLGELFADGAAAAARAAGSSSPAAPAEALQRGGALWLSRYRAAALGASDPAPELETRYCWARGSVAEAAGEPLDAGRCYRACSAALRETGLPEVPLPHCSLDTSITAKAVDAKLEVLQLHDVLAGAEAAAAGGRPADVAAVLAPVLLSCTPREALMAAVDRMTWIKALRALLAAATTLRDAATVLRCHLRLLRAGLPQVHPEIENILKHPETAPQPAPGAVAVDAARLQSSGAASDLAVAAKFLGEAFAALQGQRAQALHPTEVHSLRVLVRQALALVVAAGASLRAGGTRSALNTRSAVLRHAASDSAVVAMQMWSLDPGGAPTPEATLEWGYSLTEALGDAGALRERKGAFLAALARHLQESAAAAGSAAAAARAENHLDAAEDAEDVADGLRCGMHTCMFWLHGVRLPGVDQNPWGGDAGAAVAAPNASPEIALPSGGLRPLTTQDAVLVVWPLLKDHFAAQSPAALAKQREFLNTIFGLFPGLPLELKEAADAAWAALLETPALEIDALGVRNPFEGLVEAAAAGDSPPPWVRYLPVYRDLFRLRYMMQPSLPDAVKQAFPDAGFLAEDADRVVEAVVAPLKSDLLVNPRRYPDGWSALALLYHEAADLLLMRAAEEVPARQWGHRGDLARRAAAHRCAGHWCTAIDALCVPVDDGDDKADLWELAGSKLYDDLGDVPPRYNQISTRPQRDDPELLERAEAALRAYTAAGEVLPDEWAFKMQAGRAARRAGRPPEEWLPLMAAACHAAVHHHSALLDPIYTLHAARIKLLARLECAGVVASNATGTTTDQDIAVMRLVARYCFREETRGALAATSPALLAGGAGVLLTEVVACRDVLLRDGVSALQWCTERDRWFHRAPAMLAKLRAGDPASQVFTLAPLFSRPKAPFCINMFALQAKAADGAGAGAGPGRRGRRKKQQQAEEGGASGSGGDAVQEIDYGLCPVTRSAGIGLMESKITYFGRVRKAMSTYLLALLRNRGGEALAAAAAYISAGRGAGGPMRDADWLLKPGFDDMRALAKGCHVLATLGGALALAPLADLTVVETDASGALSPAASPSKDPLGHSREVAAQQRHLRALAARLDPAAAEAPLSRVFSLWAEHTVLADTAAGPVNWSVAITAPARSALEAAARDAAAPSVFGATELTALLSSDTACRATLQTYAELYVHLLAAHGRAEGVKSLATTLRRRYRSVKLAGEDVRRLVALVCSAGVDALKRETRAAVDAAAAGRGQGAAVAAVAAVAGAIAAPPPFVPETLGPQRLQALRAQALQCAQDQTQAAVQVAVSSGAFDSLTPEMVLAVRNQQYNIIYHDLETQAQAELAVSNAMRAQAHAAAMQAAATVAAQAVATAGQRAAAALGLPTTAPSSPTDLAVQNAVVAALGHVSAFIKAAPWFAETEPLAAVRAAATAADDLRIELLGRFLDAVHVNTGGRPKERAAQLRLSEEVAKVAKRGGGGGRGGDGGGGGGGKRQRGGAGAEQN